MKRALAYVSDIILGNTGEIIKRSCQEELIKQFAADNGIEIAGWFEDEMYNEDLLARPGIHAMLRYDKPYDIILCERVWALSRSTPVLETFFRELDRRRVGFEAATTMWDCVSQKCRRRFHPLMYQPHAAPVVKRDPAHPAHVHRPAHLHFARMVKHVH